MTKKSQVYKCEVCGAIVAVVTGGAAGIGLACAKCLAEAGAKVVLADVEVAKGEAAAEEIQAGGADALFVECDVGDKAQVDALIERTVAGFGRLDVAVANAGINQGHENMQPATVLNFCIALQGLFPSRN